MKHICSYLKESPRVSFWIFVVFLIVVFCLALRGLPGNPTANEMMEVATWRTDGPLELSPERGRFALLYSIVEEKTLFFSLPVARLATPDLAVNSEGKFVSLFAPFLSFLLVPGYILGRAFGASLVGAIATIALFAIGNAILVRAIALRLGGGKVSSSLGALAFLFGTPAFSYGTTLYQHHVSVFLLLLSIFSLMKWKGFWSLVFVALLAGISVPLDNPNAFLFMPVVLWALTRVIRVELTEKSSVAVAFRPLFLFSGIAAVIPFALFFWYNTAVNGSPFQLSGTLPGVPAISADGRALDYDPNQQSEKRLEEIEEKTAVGFFETRALLNGFFVHVASPDRGMIHYAPVAFFGIVGFVFLYRKKQRVIVSVLTGVSLTALLLYSLWGDPWGGWAFGSRYLIPAYAMLGIGIAIALETWKRSFVFVGIFFMVFSFSVGVNVLGAITSNTNPPQTQVLELERLSGKEQKYTIERNWQYLQESGSKSFIYQSWAHRLMSAETYYRTLVFLILFGSSVLFVALLRDGFLKERRV